MSGLRFRVLGALEVTEGDRVVALSAGRTATLLTALLLRPNQVILAQALIARLWEGDGDGLSSPTKSLHVTVARLRRILGPAGADLIGTSGGGYVVHATAENLDLLRFGELMDQAESMRALGSVEQETALLIEALSLWRRPAMASPASHALADDLARLDERWASAVERRVANDLTRGRHSELIGELTGLVADYPLRERYWAQLITALAGTGRRADALAAYQEVRALLATDLGVDPGPELQSLHQQVLRGDPALTPPSPRAVAGPAAATTNEPVTIRLLGPLQVSLRGHSVEMTTGRLRTVLAVLAMSAGKTVSLDRLASALWSDSMPADARRSVQLYVTRLRRTLGANLIVTRPAGYVLQIPPDQVDALRFVRLLDEAAVAPDAVRTRALLTDALALWKGTPLEDVQSASIEESGTLKLHERYLAALEQRIDLDIADGRHSDLVAELSQLTARFSMRETLWARLLIVLHRCGRQAEALARYETVRARIANELGADPGPELRQIHADLLAGRDPRPGVVHVAGLPPARDHQPPREVPAGIATFVGRREDLAMLDSLVLAPGDDHAITGPRIAVIDGSAGIGKTALAIHWSNRVADRFPDGQLFLDLSGFGPVAPVATEDALYALLHGLGVSPHEMPADTGAASSLLRSRTAGRRLLVVLDNAGSTEQVRPLLPGQGCAVLVTSRNQLRGLVARDAAVRISLTPLAGADSVALFAEVAGENRVTSEPTAAAELADLCDHTPLALRILAERIARQPEASLTEFAGELRESRDRLDYFDADDDARSDLRAVLSWSYEGLDSATARVFRLVIGLHPGGEFSLAAAAATAGLPIRQARTHLDRLAASHLLEQHRDRYRAHDLVSAYAGELARCHEDAPGDTVRRMLDWYLHTLNDADRLLVPDRLREHLDPPDSTTSPLSFSDERQAAAWCEAEYAILIGLPSWTFAQGVYEYSCRLAYLLESFLVRYKHSHDLLASHHVALAAATKVQHPRLAGHLLNAMGNVSYELRRYADADRYYERALAAFEACHDSRGRAKVLGNAAMLDIEFANYVRANSRCMEALDLCQRAGYERGRAHNLDTLGQIHFARGEFGQAIACFRRALEINKLGSDRYVQAYNRVNLGRTYAASGRHLRAGLHYEQAIGIATDIASPRAEAVTLLELGRSQRATADLEGAHHSWHRALAVLADVGDPRAGEAQDELDNLAACSSRCAEAPRYAT